MARLAALLASNFGTVGFVLGFFAVPYFYLRDCVEAHKDAAAYYKDATSNGRVPTDEDYQRVLDSLYTFSMDWWLVVAIASFLLTVFLLGDAVQFSGHLADSEGRELARSALRAFGLLVWLVALLTSKWMLAGVQRSIGVSLAQSSNKSVETASNGTGG